MSNELNDMLTELAEEYGIVELGYNCSSDIPWEVWILTKPKSDEDIIEAGGLSPLGAVKNLKEKLK
jgi:hypothetical protein